MFRKERERKVKESKKWAIYMLVLHQKKISPIAILGRVSHSTSDEVKTRRVRVWFIYNWMDV
jgi:hypothetical protein